MIPTISGHWLLGSVPEMRRDILGLLQSGAREHGDVVRIRIGPVDDVVLVNHPALVERVLVTHAVNYGRDRAFGRAARTVLGSALILNEGESWKGRRKICTPMFHRRVIERFAETMVCETEELARRWRSTPGTISVSTEMSALTLSIVGQTLFGGDFEVDAREIALAEEEAARDTFAKLRMPFQIPSYLPTPANLRLRRARRTFETLVAKVLANARRQPDAPTLAAMLLAARDEQSGKGLDDSEILDELIGFLLAGHETSANALTWTLAALARHPDVAERLRDEHAAVIGDRAATADDVGRLTETSKVLNEAMRLWPPAWFIPRRAIEDDELGGHRIPAGQVIWISPYLLHRHPEFWPDPERFDPARFDPEQETARPRHAFIPFGAGQRMCIGASFAQLEMHLVLATLLRQFDVHPPDDSNPVPNPYVTLRPQGTTPMVISRRD